MGPQSGHTARRYVTLVPGARPKAMTDVFATEPASLHMRDDDFRPIADYGLMADCTSAALVDRAGSIDWLCLPRYDSPAAFARLLDPAPRSDSPAVCARRLAPPAGHWSISPAGDFTASRRYVPGTVVVETTFRTD